MNNSSVVSIVLSEDYLWILNPEENIKVYVFKGGRKGGKTEGIARAIVLKCYTTPNFRVFAGRETQDEFESTLMAVFKDIVLNDTNFAFIKPFVKFYRGKMVFTHNNATITFLGLSDKTHDRIKGIKCDLFWLDEAHAMSELTYQLLVPSIREKGSKLIISFNPMYEWDFVAKEFIKNPAENVRVININAKDNPYLGSEDLYQIEVDKKRMSYEEFVWKWEGGFKPESDLALFDLKSLNDFSLKTSLDLVLPLITRIVIGIDPATTSKDYSNESGLCVCGLSLDRRVILLEDATGHYKPNELAKKTSELYHRYNAEAVVVETNQGGEYIRNTILSTDSTLRIIEVRAKQDKIKRILPIANQVYLGNVKAVDDKQGDKVVEQFRKFTNNGYLGSKGESPDRAEALSWAVFELLGISEFGTIGGVYQDSMFASEDFIGAIFLYRVGYIYFDSKQDKFCLLIFNVISTGKDRRFDFRDCVVGRIAESINVINSFASESISKDNGLDLLLANDSDFNSLTREFYCKTKFFTPSGEDLKTITAKTIPLIFEKISVKNVRIREENGFNDNLLRKHLINYDKEQDLESVVVRCFSELILNEN